MLVVVQNHVFQYGAETQRLENIGFALRCEVDGFRVAAAFDIEDAILAPAMLVVSDEMTLRIGRKGGLASAAEAEKQRRTAGFLVRRNFSGRMPGYLQPLLALRWWVTHSSDYARARATSRVFSKRPMRWAWQTMEAMVLMTDSGTA